MIYVYISLHLLIVKCGVKKAISDSEDGREEVDSKDKKIDYLHRHTHTQHVCDEMYE